MQFWGGKEIWIDQARAIAIICMVLCHTNDIMGCNFVFYKWVGIFFMPLFFFISGCLSKDNMTIRKLTTRIIGRLLIPYFVWAIIMQMAINKAFIYACINGDIVIVEKHILEILFGDYLWYVPCLVCIELLNFILVKISSLQHNNLHLRVFVILASFIYLLMIGEGHCFWHLDTAFASIGFYLLGYYYFRYGRFLKNKFLSILSAILFIAIAIYERGNGGVFDIHQHVLTHPLIILMTSILGVWVTVNLCCNFKMGKWLVLIGVNSLFIYIFHYKVLCAIKPILNRFISDEDYIINAIAIPMMLSISILFCNLLIKPINKYCPIIVGNKKLNF